MNRAKSERVSRRLQAGMVWANDHMYSHGACSCAWGGVKDSGLGRSHSKFGLYECVNVKLLTWEPSRTRDFWWHPYDESMGRALHVVREAPVRPRLGQAAGPAGRAAAAPAPHAQVAARRAQALKRGAVA